MTVANISTTKILSGIAPLDERVGGLQPGGNYLMVGSPGPAKMVAALQFVHAGIRRGEPGLLITSAHVDEILAAARAWGVSLDDAWEDGTLQILGFRDDFELRAIRTIAPEDVIEELSGLVRVAPARVAVDPGALFLTGGAKTLLGTAFIAWVRKQTATVLVTFSVDGDTPSLPSAADWLVTATTARLMLGRRADNLFQITVAKSLPGTGERDETITLELKPGAGLVKATTFPSRRGADRSNVNENRLMLVSLGGAHAAEGPAEAVRVEVLEGEAVAAAGRGVPRVDGVGEAAGGADQGQGAVALGVHLGQAARFVA
jgi:KaiC/GvpD/RAD55 family RecA-like ATPase